MSNYNVLVPVTDPFYSVFAKNILSITPTRIELLNPDGSQTSISGTGFSSITINGNTTFTAGTITGITRSFMPLVQPYESFTNFTSANNSLVTVWNAPDNQARFSYLFSQNDVLTGSTGNDLLEGGTGATDFNTYNGGLGQDVMRGSAGIDIFTIQGAEFDHDDIDGGLGIDVLDATAFGSFLWVNLDYAGDEVWTQTAGTWRALANMTGVEGVVGTAFNDQLFGNAGDNRFGGGAGDDTIYGRAGNDLLVGAAGADRLSGEAGEDILNGGEGADVLSGGADNDTFLFRGDSLGGLDTADGGSGTDTVSCASFTSKAWVDLAFGGNEVYTVNNNAWLAVANLTSVENVVGSEFSDDLWGNADNNTLEGGAGSDKLDGRAGNDTLLGGISNDTLIGGDGSDTMDGGGGRDSFVLSSTQTGIDEVIGGSSTDALDCSGFTTMAWVDLAYAGAEVFTQINGAWKALANVTGVEVVIGSTLSDQLLGDNESNTLIGGKGADQLTGRAARDTFFFVFGDSGQTVSTMDTVKDFTKGPAGTGDVLSFNNSLDVLQNIYIGGAPGEATNTTASISVMTGVASFAAGSGITLDDALADIATGFSTAIDTRGEFALFQVNNSGSYHLFVSDGVAGVTADDIVIKLEGITSIGSINVAADALTILT